MTEEAADRQEAVPDDATPELAAELPETLPAIETLPTARHVESGPQPLRWTGQRLEP